MANAILTGSHNARERGVFLMTMGFLDAALNALFNVGLGFTIGVAGIAASTSLTMGLIQVIKAWRLGSIESTFPLGGLLAVSLRSLVASGVVAVPLAIVAWNMPHGIGLGPAFAVLVSLTTVGMVGYIAVAAVIGLGEPAVVARTMLGTVARLDRRRG